MNTFNNKIKSFMKNNSLTEIAAASLLGLLMIVQRFLAGGYKPVMDDWFLYGDLYGKLIGRIKYFAIPNEKFAIRPLAGFFDCFVNAPLFKHLWLVELILTLSLAIGAFLIIKTLRKNNAAGAGFFLCLVCLFPVSLEATYWIAAATRICYSMFFIGAAIYSLDFYYKTRRKCALALFAVFGMMCVSFYEPAIIMYILLAVFIAWSNHKEKRDFLPLVFTVLHIIVIGLYYIINSGSGEIESRGGLLDGNIAEHTLLVFDYTKKIFAEYSLSIIKEGFGKGALIVLGGHRLIKIAMVTLLSAIFGIFSALCIRKHRFSLKIFVFGIIMFIGGLSLNFLLGSDRIPLRLVYFSYLGIGIMLDELLALFPYRINQAISFLAVSALAFVFTVAGIGEVRDYQKVSDFDVYITQQIIDLDTENNVTNVDKNTYVFGGQHCYEETKCIHYLDHIRGASGSYADFTGCMQHLTGKAWTNNLVPFTYGDIHILKPYIDEEGVCSFYNIEYDKTVVPATIVPNDDNYDVVRMDGSLIGTLNKVDDVRYQFFD